MGNADGGWAESLVLSVKKGHRQSGKRSNLLAGGIVGYFEVFEDNRPFRWMQQDASQVKTLSKQPVSVAWVEAGR